MKSEEKFAITEMMSIVFSSFDNCNLLICSIFSGKDKCVHKIIVYYFIIAKWQFSIDYTLKVNFEFIMSRFLSNISFSVFSSCDNLESSF